MYFSNTESLEISCSDCKLELNKKRWTNLLLNWLRKCVNKNMQSHVLTPEWLGEIITKYKDDICDNDIDRAIMSPEDLEPFLRYKYPILRLRYFTEEKDNPKKYYIMASVLLYHCCVSSVTGAIEGDICRYLASFEKEMILKFCESLSEMEITVNNVESAINMACAAVPDPTGTKKPKLSPRSKQRASNKDSNATTASEISQGTSQASSVAGAAMQEQRKSSLSFKSSVTILSSNLTESSSFSKVSLASETSDTYSIKQDDDGNTTAESINEMAVFNVVDGECKDDGVFAMSAQEANPNMVALGEDFPICSPAIIKQQEPCGCIEGSSQQLCCSVPDCAGCSRSDTGLSDDRECDINARKIKCRPIKETTKVRKRKIDREDCEDWKETKKTKDGEDCDCKIEEKKKEPLMECAPECKGKKGKKGRRDRKNVDTCDGRQNMDGDKGAVKECEKSDVDDSDVCNRDWSYMRDDLGDTSDTCNKYGDWDKSETSGTLDEKDQRYKDKTKDEEKALTYEKQRRKMQEKEDKLKAKKEAMIARRERKRDNDQREKKSRIGAAAKNLHKRSKEFLKKKKNRRTLCISCCLIFTILAGLITTILTILFLLPDKKTSQYKDAPVIKRPVREETEKHVPAIFKTAWSWQCNNTVCVKVYHANLRDSNVFIALSRCVLTCSGPQLWPLPIGEMEHSKEIVALSTSKLEYRFQTPSISRSDAVHQYLAEAFKLFLGDLAKLERIDHYKRRRRGDMDPKKMHIYIEVEADTDPKLRLNTDESYNIKLVTLNNTVSINVTAPSFCGVRNGLETLSQLIMLDQATGELITLSTISIRDAPSYKYRGLMLDTARNFIPLPDILRTIDGMASAKMNTFHWRITDSASFPLLLPTLSNLFEYGAYDRAQVYTKEDVKTVVSRAGVRGIRVLIEVALPGPVGRAWSWSDDATCQKKNDNYTCDNVLCLHLKMKDSVFEVIQHIYSEIIQMTGIDDVFHMSDGMFSLSNCYYSMEERTGFLERALDRLKIANKGFIPTLPIIWYTPHLIKDFEEKRWERMGIQIYEWPTHHDSALGKFKAIHSSKWDLSCEVRNQRCTKYRSWQEMYAWRSWRTLDSFTIEGGESILWTDMVDGANLDFHLWPRALAVAERLWSDIAINTTATGKTYLRMDGHRWRMLLRGLKVEPVWPVWCSFNPNFCFSKLHYWEKNTKK